MADRLQQVIAFVESTAAPAASSAVSAVNQQVQSNVIPAAASAASLVNDYAQTAAIPAASSGIVAAQNRFQTVIAPAAEVAYSSAIDVLASTAATVKATQFPAIPELNAVQLIVKEKGLEAWNLHLSNNRTLSDIMQPVLEFLTPIVDYVAKNPIVLLPLAIPAIQFALVLIGFSEAGIVAGSIAAAIQSWMGNVPKGSLFAFLQSNGAKGFASQALRLGFMWLVIAVVLATLGKMLIDRGAIPESVGPGLWRTWNATLIKFGKGDEVMPPVESASGDGLASDLVAAILLGAGTLVAML